jgi:Cu2+-exporting ATPase
MAMSEPMSHNDCYHCGLPVPSGLDLTVAIAGAPRAMCCAGCQGVAQAIVDNGLADYYRNRETLPAAASREPVPALLAGLKLYDHADFQKSFVRALGEREREASLIIEGITCAACIWLNEQHVARLPGVSGVAINFTTRRARVRWDESRIKLSDILAAIVAIGYRAYPYDAAKSEALSRAERRSALWRLFVAGFAMMQVMMYAVPAYFAGGDMAPDIAVLLRWASLVLTLPVIVYSAAPFFRGAWRDLRLLRVGMDVPVALGIGAAFAASVWATLTDSGAVYFDSVTMFVFLLLGGRFLEMTARQRAVSLTETLTKLIPALAQRISGYPQDQAAESVMVADLVAGDVVLVRPGETIPADGRVIAGVSSANESLLTGESAPVAKSPGAAVIGGALNVDSALFVQVEQVGEATRLSAIIRLMERAAMEKPRLAQSADRIAAHFIAALLLLALAVAIVWSFIDPQRALWITVSVLVVSCPCALSLATPVALTIASGAMARVGLLVTRGHAVETLARATHFVFDKTGTLTTGRMRVLDVLPLAAFDREECLALAAGIEQHSEHAIAAALLAAAGGGARDVSDAVSEPGRGISALLPGEPARRVRIGRPDYVAALHGQPLPEPAQRFAAGSDSVIALGDDAGWLALVRLGDEIRPQAAAMAAALRDAGRQLVLLSGDARPVAEKVARAVGISSVEAEVSPQGKRDYVSRLQADGAIVAMVGDGINDAPVLAQAQVSVAMGGGSQLAHSQADLILLSENLDHLRQGFFVARRCLQIIRQNLLWAFAYNFVALPLAIFGFVTPWMAAIGMSASSLLVLLNSLRLQRGAES